MKPAHILTVVALIVTWPALAGPPYVTDDPAPTDLGHFEIYTFGAGSHSAGGSDGTAGIDFNYGGAKDLQLTATLPVTWERPHGGKTIGGVGNIELAAKYRFLHQDDVGVDVAVFPRVFLPSASHRLGDQHASVLLPLWIGKEWGPWSTFGGGGCAIHRGGDSRDFCVMGWAVTHQVTPKLQLGAEIYHQTPDAQGARATTGIGFGAHYDLTEALHLVASLGPGLQHADENGQYAWYAALLLTF